MPTVKELKAILTQHKKNTSSCAPFSKLKKNELIKRVEELGLKVKDDPKPKAKAKTKEELFKPTAEKLIKKFTATYRRKRTRREKTDEGIKLRREFCEELTGRIPLIVDKFRDNFLNYIQYRVFLNTRFLEQYIRDCSRDEIINFEKDGKKYEKKILKILKNKKKKFLIRNSLLQAVLFIKLNEKTQLTRLIQHNKDLFNQILIDLNISKEYLKSGQQAKNFKRLGADLSVFD